MAPFSHLHQATSPHPLSLLQHFLSLLLPPLLFPYACLFHLLESEEHFPSQVEWLGGQKERDGGRGKRERKWEERKEREREIYIYVHCFTCNIYGAHLQSRQLESGAGLGQTYYLLLQ